PYLAADASRVEAWRQRLAGGGFKVGLVWQGNPRHQWDRWRSIPLARLAPLADVPGVRLVNLQFGPGAEQAGGWRGRAPLEQPPGDSAGGPASFAQTAALLKCLDLLISVDSAPAHLGGALGVPVWVPVAAVSDWRWLVGRDDSPWYPTLRLFRQRQLGDWDEV